MDVKHDSKMAEQGEVPKRIIWRSPDRWIVSVDLGQANDYTAVAAIQAYEMREDPVLPILHRYDVRHLQRFPLGLSYVDMVRDIGRLLQRPPFTRDTELIVDNTGVGRAVSDIFNAEGLKPVCVTITAGTGEGEMHGTRRYNVSKGYIVSLLDAKLHTGELRFAGDLTEMPVMQSELKDFKRRVSESGHTSFEARGGKHDDMVLAVGIGLWRAVKHRSKFNSGRTTDRPKVILGYSNLKRGYR